MKEIEVKILRIDTAGIKSVLRKIGAKRILKPTLFREYYFQIPGLTKEERDYYSFRLRSEGKKNILTAKHKHQDKHYHINDEAEVEVSDMEHTRQLLHVLNFNVFRQREKTREIFKVGHVKVAIDKYPKIEPYLEIEGSRKKDVVAIVKKLGYSLKDTTQETATEIIKKAGQDPNKLMFK